MILIKKSTTQYTSNRKLPFAHLGVLHLITFIKLLHHLVVITLSATAFIFNTNDSALEILRTCAAFYAPSDRFLVHSTISV